MNYDFPWIIFLLSPPTFVVGRGRRLFVSRVAPEMSTGANETKRGISAGICASRLSTADDVVSSKRLSEPESKTHALVMNMTD